MRYLQLVALTLLGTVVMSMCLMVTEAPTRQSEGSLVPKNPAALPPELEIWVDAEVMRRGRVILGGGSRSMKVLTVPATLVALPNVTVVEGLATPVAPA